MITENKKQIGDIPLKIKESDSYTFSEDLKEIMFSTYLKNQTEWSTALSLHRSAVSQWLRYKTIPSPENAFRIYNIISEYHKEDHIYLDKLNKLYKTPLYNLTPVYTKYRAENLEEYAGYYLLEKISLDLRRVPLDGGIHFLNDVSSMLNIFSTLHKEERLISIEFFKLIDSNKEHRNSLFSFIKEIFLTNFDRIKAYLNAPHLAYIEKSDLRSESDNPSSQPCLVLGEK